MNIQFPVVVAWRNSMEHGSEDLVDLSSITSSYFYENIPCGSPYGAGCGEYFPKASIPGHELLCDAVPVPCPFSGCDQRPSRKELVSHELNCSFLPVPCIHEGCIERPRKIDLSSHLESCEACTTRNEEGHCTHVDRLDAFLAEILGEHPHTSFSEYFSDVSSNHGSRSDFWEDCLSRNWKSEKVSTEQTETSESIKQDVETVACVANTWTDTETTLAAKHCGDTTKTLRDHLELNNASSESQYVSSDWDRYVIMGQPPVFSPPPHASKDEIRLLRQKHLESLKNLTSEERLERRRMRNRQNAILSRKKRYERLEALRRRREEVQERLQQVASELTELRKYTLRLHDRREKCVSLLRSVCQLSTE